LDFKKRILMTTTTVNLRSNRAETFFSRHAWKILLGVIFMIGFFGISDLFGGASDLQSGEKVYMTGVTGMTWNDLKAASPTVARMIDTIFRTNGVTLATLALLSLAICLTGFRKGERWAWIALWALPFWMALTVFIIASVEKQPGAGTPVPVISGSILLVIFASTLLFSALRFFRGSSISSSAQKPNL
jgi:hypothetical protein